MIINSTVDFLNCFKQFINFVTKSGVLNASSLDNSIWVFGNPSLFLVSITKGKIFYSILLYGKIVLGTLIP